MDRNDKMIRQAYFDKRSLSARRAWIEMLVPEQHSDGISVALRKESVDRNVYIGFSFPTIILSLSARRAWIEIILLFSWYVPPFVALRKESVDRNP